jgi:hypothetical protein
MDIETVRSDTGTYKIYAERDYIFRPFPFSPLPLPPPNTQKMPTYSGREEKFGMIFHFAFFPPSASLLFFIKFMGKKAKETSLRLLPLYCCCEDFVCARKERLEREEKGSNDETFCDICDENRKC